MIEPPGNAARSRSTASAAGVEVAHDGRDEMVHGRKLLQREQLRHPHRARATHAREIVPQQVHDHQVFRPVLVALGQRAAERGVVLGPRPRGRVPLIGRVSTWRPFWSSRRKRSGDALSTHRSPIVEEGGEGGRIALPEPAVELERRLRKRRLEALRQVRLEDVARDDVVSHAGDGVEVAPVGERRAESDGLGAFHPEDRIGWGFRELRRGRRARGRPSGHPGRPAQALSRHLQPRPGPHGLRRAALGQPGRDEPRRLQPVVPRDHPVVQAEHHVRNAPGRRSAAPAAARAPRPSRTRCTPRRRPETAAARHRRPRRTARADRGWRTRGSTSTAGPGPSGTADLGRATLAAHDAARDRR